MLGVPAFNQQEVGNGWLDYSFLFIAWKIEERYRFKCKIELSVKLSLLLFLFFSYMIICTLYHLYFRWDKIVLYAIYSERSLQKNSCDNKQQYQPFTTISSNYLTFFMSYIYLYNVNDTLLIFHKFFLYKFSDAN